MAYSKRLDEWGIGEAFVPKMLKNFLKK